MLVMNEVVLAVAKKLRQLYPDVPVYTENVKQGLEKPCFFITCEKPVMRRYMDARWYCRTPVTVYCFPGADKQNAELGSVFLQMFHALELIDCGGPLRGSNMKASRSDGVGVFQADYSCFVNWKEEVEQGDGMMLELKLI